MTKNPNPRILLARVRQGDYAHPGGEEAIDMVLTGLFSKCPPGKLKMLDVGCGRGGTAAYIKNKIGSDIQGIDLDEGAIQDANRHYPGIEFINADILDASKKVVGFFDVIYLFNVFYAIEDQQESLRELARMSKPGTVIAIFDYINKNEEKFAPIKDLAGKDMKPVSLSDLKKYFENTGWDLLEIKDLSDEYEIWYRDFLEKLEIQKDKLLEEFTEDAYKKVHETFSTLLNDLKKRYIGGAVAYAKITPLVTDFFSSRREEKSEQVSGKKLTSKL